MPGDASEPLGVEEAEFQNRKADEAAEDGKDVAFEEVDNNLSVDESPEIAERTISQSVGNTTSTLKHIDSQFNSAIETEDAAGLKE